MDYNKLNTFLLVARENSVTRAARILGRTQSAITQQVAAIEDELGLRLFERKKNMLFLTREGQFLLDKASAAFRAIDHEVAALQGREALTSETLVVGVSQDLAASFLAEKLEPFRKKWPNARIRLVLGGDRELEEALARDDLDVALITVFRDRKFFDVAEAFWMEEAPVTSPSYLKERRLTRAVDLLEARLFDFTEDFSCWSPWFEESAPKLVKNLHIRSPDIVVRSHEVMKNLLPSGGVAMLPVYLVEAEIRAGELVLLFPKSTRTSVGVDIARRKRGNVSPLQQAFFEALAI